MEAGDSVILIMPGEGHPIQEHIPMVALTAGVMHRPMLAMGIIHMQLIPPVLMALAGALGLAEDSAEEDGGKS